MSIYTQTTIVTKQPFEDETGSLFDPSSVKCKTRSPAGTETTYTYGSSSNLTKLATGYYQCVFTPDSAGVWSATWYGNDTGGGLAQPYSILIKKLPVTAF